MGTCLGKETTERRSSGENEVRQSSSTKLGNLADLKAKISTTKGLIVIDFFATWCPPCQAIAPTVEAMSKEFTSVLFLKVDVDENREAVQEYNIEAMPTFVFIKGGQTVDTMRGADKDQLRSLITKHQ